MGVQPAPDDYYGKCVKAGVNVPAVSLATKVCFSFQDPLWEWSVFFWKGVLMLSFFDGGGVDWDGADGYGASAEELCRDRSGGDVELVGLSWGLRCAQGLL